ncbi:MAG TPA: hypothetical protein VEK15_18960, partial [Vicinamibacteria bacterium]|nr:hypothetical protein [Vicinamibacteria bacterium]
VIRTRAAEGGGPDEELEIDANSSAWSPDGVLFVERSGDIWVWALAERSVSPFLETPFRERNVALSKDGRLVAYDSDETGQTEVYVRTFPDSGKRWRVSTEGGRHAAFRRDGGEIYYVTADGWLVAVTVTLRPSTGAGTQEDLRFGQPQKLFALDQKDEARARQFDTLDGETFIVNRTRRSGSRTPLTLVLNVDLEERAPRPD